MILETELFGALNVAPDDIFSLPEGLLGFGGYKRYVLVPLEEYPPFLGLQCVDEPELSFVVIDPRIFMAAYQPDLTAEDLQELELASPAEALMYVIVVLDSNPALMTANLCGPVLINPRRKIAKQIAMPEGRYVLKYRLYERVAPEKG